MTDPDLRGRDLVAAIAAIAATAHAVAQPPSTARKSAALTCSTP